MYEKMRNVEFFSLDKLIQGRVIINIGIDGKDDLVESMAVEMNWMTQEQVAHNTNMIEKRLLEDDPRGFTQEQLKSYAFVAETLSQNSGWYYVGIATFNPDRKFLGFHDLKTLPELARGRFNVIS